MIDCFMLRLTKRMPLSLVMTAKKMLGKLGSIRVLILHIRFVNGKSTSAICKSESGTILVL